jgi:small subunit ribosomal protein S13
MPRVLNTQIPDNKRVVISLTYIKGIGKSRSKRICSKLGISENTYINELTKNQLSNIVSFVQKTFKTGSKVENIQISNIRNLIKISSYRGLRHFKRLPVRGQRTKTNAQTVRRINKKI